MGYFQHGMLFLSLSDRRALLRKVDVAEVARERDDLALPPDRENERDLREPERLTERERDAPRL